jgi:glycosyltransferase involved in cell wall biosynthesis
MSCGVPVVGFSVGGITDMVRPGITGSLVPEKNTAGLAAAISDLFANPERSSEMAGNCRSIALKEYSYQIQAERYEKLYEEMVETAGRRNKKPSTV